MVSQGHLDADNKGGIIIKLTKSESKKIKAGASITASFLNALIRGFNSFVDIGRYFGSSVRRLFGGKYCPIK